MGKGVHPFLRKSRVLSPARAGSRVRVNTGVAVRLGFIVAAAALPLLILSSLAIYRAHAVEARVQEAALLDQARTLARLADREAELVETKLKTLATSTALAEADLSAFERELRAASLQHVGTVIELVDRAGEKLLSTSWPPGIHQPRMRGGDLSRIAMSTGAPAISNLHRQASTGEMIMALAVPVFLKPDTSVPNYVLGAAIPRSRLAALFAAVQPVGVAGWRATLVDRDNRIVVRSLGDDARIGSPVRPQIANYLLPDKEGFVHGQATIEGENAVFAFAQARLSHLTALVSVPVATLQAPLWTDMIRTVGIGGLLLAAGLLTALLVARHFVQALRHLERAQAGAPVRTGVREIDDLGNSLARLGTERTNTQRAMQYQLNLLHAVAESSVDAVFVVDPTGRISFANVKAARLSGWPSNELIGKPLQDFLAESDIGTGTDQSADPPLSRILQEGGPKLAHEEVFLRRDHAGVEVECSTAPVVIGEETHGAVMIVRDITGERRAKKMLRENEARLLDLVQTLDLAAILVRDMNGRILFWSRGCEELYGWSVAEAVGQDAGTLLRTVFPSGRLAVQDELAREGTWTGDLIHTRRDACLITVSAHKVLRFDEDGEPLAVMESLTDVTSFRAAETKLVQLNNDLEERVATEITAREAAQLRAAHAERMQALGQLAGGIAHDFNNVLQIINSGAAMIERHPTDATGVARLAQVIGDAAGRGASITRRMLAFARRGDLQAERIEVQALFEDVSEMCGYTMGPDIRIDIALRPDVPPVQADKGQLETALLNLATNARDAMPGGGVISLAAEAETVRKGQEHPANLDPGQYVRLSVRDTGVGMERHVLARVAEPFFTTKGVGKGTGLGLSMAKGFAEQSDGSLSIESTPGVGTTVTIWLPQAAAETENTEQRVPAFDGAVPPAARETGRILLVDDDDMVRETITAQLEDAGFAVIPVSSGEEAIALLQGGQAADVLITDLSMPGMNGLALIRSAQTMRPDIRAILLTGYSGDAAALAVGGAVSGSYSLIRKPVPGAQLIGRVAALLESVPG